MGASVTLGRDGMGDDATEADFDAWVAFVAKKIDAACGFEVSVDERGKRDVQTDAFSGDEFERETIESAIHSLWNEWCADGAPAS